MHDYYEGGGWGAGQWLAMSLLMLLFWAALIALVVWAVRASRTDATPPPATAPTPLEVLADRFAHGEIDADEFSRSRELLTAAPGPTRSRGERARP